MRRVDEAREMGHHPGNRGSQGELGRKEDTAMSNTAAKSNGKTDPCA